MTDSPHLQDPGSVFAALGDRRRRQILDALVVAGGATATSLAMAVPISRQALVKHLAVLDKAGLVERHRAGKEVRFRARPQGVQATARWLDALVLAWDERLAALKTTAEGADPAVSMVRRAKSSASS